MHYLTDENTGENSFNPLNAELNPIRHLLALVGARHIVHVSRIRVNFLKLELKICLVESWDGSVSIMTRLSYTAFDFQLEKGVSSSQRNSTPAA